MGGLRQPRIVDVLVRPVLKISFRVIESNTRLKLAHAAADLADDPAGGRSRSCSASSRPIRRCVTPAEARARYGYDLPRDAHLELRARQAARVFGEGAEPSDEGLIESEPILGAMA